MIDVLRSEGNKLRTVQWWLAGIVATALLTAALTFFGGLAVGSIVFPLHEHALRSDSTVFYLADAGNGPHVEVGSRALLVVAAVSIVALALFFLCVWTAFTVMLATVLSRRRGA